MSRKFRVFSALIVFILLLGMQPFFTISYSADNNGVNVTFRDIAYNGTDKYVAVGNYGKIKFSVDGTEWKSIESPVDNHLERVIWNGKMFLAVGYGAILTSQDGINWTVQSKNQKYILRSVAWNGQKFVAVGESNTILVSSDGADWQKVNSPFNTTDLRWYDIIWNGKIFAAVGQYGRISFSIDGIKWVNKSPGLEKDFYGIIWTRNQFIVVGYEMLKSSDGNDWSQPKEVNNSMTTVRIAANDSIIIATGDFGYLTTSKDGNIWEDGSTNNTGNATQRIIWDGKRFIGPEEGGGIITSTDGRKWKDISSIMKDNKTPINFNDLKPGHWAYDAIIEMVQKGIICGNADGTFAINAFVTREQFAKMMVLSLGLPLINPDEATFMDLDSGYWSYKYVETAKKYLTGFQLNNVYYFKGYENAVREDMAVALVKGLKLENQSVDIAELKTTFKDYKEISPELQKYILIAYKYKLIAGYNDGTFKPQGTLTRAEAAALLLKVTKSDLLKKVAM